MPHPNLSPRLNAIVDSQLMYRDMQLGEILEITAKDARTGLPGILRLQVVHLEQDKDGGKAPIYRILKPSLALYGDDRQTPVNPKFRELAGPGISCIHIPRFVWSMLGFGGIGLGRDYALEYVGGREDFLYIHAIMQIARQPAPPKWRVPRTAIKRYLEAVKLIQAAAEKRKQEHQALLRRALVVKTANSTYRLSAVDEDGRRTLRKDGEDVARNAKLHGASVGGCMVVDIETEPRVWQPLQTSTVASIEAMD